MWLYVQQRQEELLGLWQRALSAEAAQSLDMKRYLTASLVRADLQTASVQSEHEEKYTIYLLEQLNTGNTPCSKQGRPLLSCTPTAIVLESLPMQ